MADIEVHRAGGLVGGAEVEESVLAAAVAEINRLYAAKGLEMARAIGSYVLETFFANDTANFRTHGKKHVTFRKLAEREDLRVSYGVIWNAVAVVDQLRLLPENIAEALPLSHHKLLLPVKDADKKVKLASEAVEKNLGKRDLELRVKKVRAKEIPGEKRGRKPESEILKRVKKLERALEGLDTKRFSPEKVAALGEEGAKDLKDRIQDAWDRLGVLRTLLVAQWP